MVGDGGAGPLGPHLDPGAAARARRRRRAGRGGQRRDPARPRARRAPAARRAARRGQPRQRRPGPPRLPRPRGGRGAADLAARGPRRHRRPRARPRPARERQAARRRPRTARRDPRPSCSARPCSTARRCSGDRRTADPCVSAASPPWPRCCAGRATLLDAGGTVEEVLWALWSGTGWPEPLRHRVQRGGAAARLAHRDLDALCALFETAARAEEQRGHTSVEAFLATLVAQEIPADTLADRGIRGEAVRLLTAHRSKGLEWRLVVVAHVQEGSLARPAPPRDAAARRPHRGRALRRAGAPARHHHPRAARRGAPAVLRRLHPCPRAPGRHRRRVARRRGRAALAVPRRARRRRSRHQSGPATPPVVARRVWSASCGARRPTPTSPARCARPPCERLARLAAETRPDGRPLVPAADPATWWGTRDLSHAEQPMRAGRRAGRALRQCAGRAAGVPGEVVPRARGRRGTQVQPGAGVRQPGARDRRPGRQGRARSGSRWWSRS